MKPTFYITTPIYYPSDKLHIGNGYCTVCADTMARWKRLRGYDVYFLTGTDEHGQKIETVAKAAGVTPQAFVDNIVAGVVELWKILDITNDDFIRTTQPRHKTAVQTIFRKLYEQGDIYKGKYKGWYCTPCEAFWTETQLKEGKCPDCGREVKMAEEEAYFFRAGKYQDWLIQYIRDNPDFIQPVSRANEMLQNFLLPGLEDLCVSRTSFTWGIPVDFDTKHVVYVWVDALSNYITALGCYGQDDSLYQKYWPADVHLVGKEIVRFHTIIWPIMLHALGLPLPKQVFGHGWWTVNGEKMSKSKGNVIDPVALVGRYGLDAVKYFLLREIPFGSDGDFSYKGFVSRINSDLANDLGNLASRTVAMIQKYFDGAVPARAELEGIDTNLQSLALDAVGIFAEQMDRMQFSLALAELWKLVSECNRYIDSTAPWVLARDEANKPRLGTVLYNLAESLRIIAVALQSCLSNTPGQLFRMLGVADDSLKTWDSIGVFGKLPAGLKVETLPALFPRLDPEVELPVLAAMGGGAKQEAKKTGGPIKPEITIDEFARNDLRLAKVITAEAVEKSDKLLKLTVEVGALGTRTVVSGIAKYYKPEELVGKTVVLVCNLKPAKLRGVLSEGMILCACDDEGNLKIVSPEGPLPDGSEVR
jgi:methionyl-tRNA synthetase